MGTIGQSVIVVAALGWAATAARAEGGPAVRVGGLAPFSEAELEEALRMRLGAEHDVEVVSGARVVTITVDGTSRSIRLGSERGMAAARVVALVAAAIVLDAEAAAEERVVAFPAASVTPATSALRDEAAPELEGGFAAAPSRRWTLGALVSPASAERTRPGVGAVLAFDQAGRDGVRVTMTVGFTSASRELAAPSPAIRTIEVPVRAGAWLGDRFAVGASAVAIPYSTSGGVGDRNVLFGAGVMARAQMTFTSGLGVSALAGVDGMASAVEYRWDGEAVLASGRFRPWLAFGVTWEGGP